MIFTLRITCLGAGGRLADRFGRKWVFTAPRFVVTPLYLIGGLTTDWVVLVGVLTVTNFVGTMQWPAMQAFMSDSDEERVATAFSFMESLGGRRSDFGPWSCPCCS